jgi:SAM-dependent methyltransferase
MSEEKIIDLKFYKKTLRPDRQRSYEIIAETIKKELNPKSVFDYGCGCGWVLHHLLKNGVTDVGGLELLRDGIPITPDDVKGLIEYRSLTEEGIDYGRKFDLAVSFEVVEHIDAKYADTLVANIIRNTDTVMFSAATPGQGGYGHINEQPYSYWEKKFETMGFKTDEELSNRIRNNWKERGCSSWYWKNTNILRRIV